MSSARRASTKAAIACRAAPSPVRRAARSAASAAAPAARAADRAEPKMSTDQAAATAALQSLVNGGSFGSERKNSSAEKRCCSRASEKTVTGLLDVRKPTSPKSVGPRADFAEDSEARARSVSAFARSTTGAPPAASDAACWSVSGSGAARTVRSSASFIGRSSRWEPGGRRRVRGQRSAAPPRAVDDARGANRSG